MKKNNNLYNTFIHISLVVLIGIALLLLQQNSKLKNQIIGEMPIGIKVGDKFPSMYVKDTNNVDAIINTSDSKEKLLFVFSNNCPYCVKTFPFWKELNTEFKLKYDILGVSIDTIEEQSSDLKTIKSSYNVYFAKNKEFRKKYNIIGVPMTLLINTSGTVKNLWLGSFSSVLSDSIKTQLRK